MALHICTDMVNIQSLFYCSFPLGHRAANMAETCFAHCIKLVMKLSHFYTKSELHARKGHIIVPL